MIDALLTLSLLAQQRPDPLPAIPRLEVRRAANPLSIDGKLNDSAWAQAEAVTFQCPWPNQTGAKQKTTVRLLWDDKYLY
ncbi:MAG: sugar-binding protein, partial [Acidobacteriota bacterium]